MPSNSSPTVAPAQPARPLKPYRRRATRGEKLAATAFFVALAFFFVNYVLGGLSGAGFVWYQVQQTALDFAAWRINVYVLILTPGILALALLLRHCLPVITIPLVRNTAGEVQVLHRWYRPGSLQFMDGEVTWREGKYRAYANKTSLARNGALLGYLLARPVERNVNEATLEVTYDTVNIETYASRSLNRRLQREVRERVLQEERAFQELERL